MERPKLAVFDFDGTLSKGDSLVPFLAAVVGWPRVLQLLAGRGLWAFLCPPEGVDRRTSVKNMLLTSCLAGRRVADLAPAVAKIKAWVRWLEPQRAALLDHAKAGHKLLIASGSLDLYLPAIFAGMGTYDLLCTEMEIKDGVLTGAMRAGNCVRALKAEKIAAYMKANGPYAESWGYGNAPHDLPMLALMDHKTIV